MKQYLVIYYAPKEAMESMQDITEEQAIEGMKPWYEWMQNVGEKLLDGGNPFGEGWEITPTEKLPSEKMVSGYSMLQAEDIDDAMKLLDGHPHFNWFEGCSLGLYEITPMEMDGKLLK